MEINIITKPVPYIERSNNQYIVVFAEPGSKLSTYVFADERDAQICANKVKPLVIAAANENIISTDLISNEDIAVNPLVTETIDDYGYKTITTEYYKGKTITQILDSNGNEVTAKARQVAIDEIIATKKAEEEATQQLAEEARLTQEIEDAKLPAQVNYTAIMTDTLLESVSTTGQSEVTG